MRPNQARWAAALSATLTALLALNAPSEARRHVRHPRVTPSPFPPATAGMTIAMDPLTGALRMPTSAELLRLSPSEENSLSRSAAGLLEIRRPDGAVGLDLQGRFQDFMMVQIRPDGKKVFKCVESPTAPKQEER